MINEFITAIADRLAEIFGDDVPIYAENVPQGLKTGCFYINCINHTQNIMTFGKRKMTDFDVMYLPAEGSLSAESEINEALVYLTDEFTQLEVNGKIFKGTDVSVQKTDGVLHYFISFDFNTLNDRGDVMESLEIDTDVMRNLEIKGDEG